MLNDLFNTQGMFCISVCISVYLSLMNAINDHLDKRSYFIYTPMHIAANVYLAIISTTYFLFFCQIATDIFFAIALKFVCCSLVRQKLRTWASNTNLMIMFSMHNMVHIILLLTFSYWHR